MMSKAPVRNTDDLRNQKVWMPNSHATTLEVMEAFGIKPIPLPIADVRTSLQTGLIDAVTVSPIGAIVLQWHTQVKYLTDMPLAYMYGMLAVDRKTFAKISPEDQKIVRDTMQQVFRNMDQNNRKNNVEALKMFSLIQTYIANKIVFLILLNVLLLSVILITYWPDLSMVLLR